MPKINESELKKEIKSGDFKNAYLLYGEESYLKEYYASELKNKIVDKTFEAFNFHVINVADGNDMDQLKAAFDEAKTVKGMPTAIIMKTVKGKGVSFMENQVGWHGKAPNDEQYAQAMEDLEKVGEALCQK